MDGTAGFSVLFLILARRDWFQIVHDSTPAALDTRAKESVLEDLERSGKYLPYHRHHSSRGLLKGSLVLNVCNWATDNFPKFTETPRRIGNLL